MKGYKIQITIYPRYYYGDVIDGDYSGIIWSTIEEAEKELHQAEKEVDNAWIIETERG